MENKKNHPIKDSKLGTWIGVGLVGVVILITYIVLFNLYMGRV